MTTSLPASRSGIARFGLSRSNPGRKAGWRQGSGTEAVQKRRSALSNNTPAAIWGCVLFNAITYYLTPFGFHHSRRLGSVSNVWARTWIYAKQCCRISGVRAKGLATGPDRDAFRPELVT